MMNRRAVTFGQPLCLVHSYWMATTSGGSHRRPTRSRRRACLHAEVRLDAIVPRVVVERAKIYPRLIAHLTAPAEERCGVGTDGMPQLPRSIGGDLEHLVGNERRWRGIRQDGREQPTDSTSLRIHRGSLLRADVPRHWRVDDSWLDDRHSDAECLDLLR